MLTVRKFPIRFCFSIYGGGKWASLCVMQIKKYKKKQQKLQQLCRDDETTTTTVVDMWKSPNRKRECAPPGGEKCGPQDREEKNRKTQAASLSDLALLGSKMADALFMFINSRPCERLLESAT